MKLALDSLASRCTIFLVISLSLDSMQIAVNIAPWRSTFAQLICQNKPGQFSSQIKDFLNRSDGLIRKMKHIIEKVHQMAHDQIDSK